MTTQTVQENNDERPVKPKRASPATRSNKTYSELFEALAEREQIFVRSALRHGEYDKAASEAGHRNAYSLLGRVAVRECLLSAAPYCESHITARLVRPFVLQQLVNSALEGDVSASKVVLSLSVDAPKVKADYTKREATASPSTTSGVTDGE